MTESIREAEQAAPEKLPETWHIVRDYSKFPERYVEGVERAMAEALWDNVLEVYPGLMAINEVNRPSLSMAAGGFLGSRDSWAVGQAGDCIRQARTCAEVARTMLENSTPERTQ